MKHEEIGKTETKTKNKNKQLEDTIIRGERDNYKKEILMLPEII